jgi:hypothetical protein
LGVFTTFEVCIPNLSTHKQEASVETWVQNWNISIVYHYQI